MANLAGVVLPQEIWIQIFKFLNTSDIVNLCNVSETHKYLLKEKDVVKYFDVGGDFNFYNVNFYDYIIENVEYRFIKSLNINQFYWIGLKDLRDLLKYLPNLQELFAIDTKLGLRRGDIKLYKNLKTLAITVLHRDCDADPCDFRNNMYLLKKLCINIVLKQEHFSSLYKLFNELVGLQELWINDTDDSVIEPIKYDYIVYKLKFLEKLVIKSKVNIPFLDYKPFGLAKFFETRRFKSIVMCYERTPPASIISYRRISLFQPFETEIEMAWDIISKFQCEMPYGPKSAQKFYAAKQIKDIDFVELNFYHSRCFCNPSFTKAMFIFLKAKNSKNLQKLCVKSCIFQGCPRTKTQSLADLYPHNRKYPIVEVIENCKNLKTLELMSCDNCDSTMNGSGDSICNVTILYAYQFISYWVGLEKLTVKVPSHVNGKFLEDVLMQCKNLKYLRVISYSTNVNLNMNLYAALPYGNSLEDLYIENKDITFERVFSSLNSIKSHKLRRICLITTYNATYAVPSIKKFLDENDQVIFVYFAVSQKNPTELQDLLDTYKKDNPAKVFYAKKKINHFTGAFPIPHVHREFMARDTEVSTVDFSTFK